MCEGRKRERVLRHDTLNNTNFLFQKRKKEKKKEQKKAKKDKKKKRHTQSTRQRRKPLWTLKKREKKKTTRILKRLFDAERDLFIISSTTPNNLLRNDATASRSRVRRFRATPRFWRRNFDFLKKRAVKSVVCLRANRRASSSSQSF